MVDETILFDRLSDELQRSFMQKVVVIGDQKQRDYYINVLPLLIPLEFHFYQDESIKGEKVYLFDNYSTSLSDDPVEFLKGTNFQEHGEITLIVINQDASIEKRSINIDEVSLIEDSQVPVEIMTSHGKVILDIQDMSMIEKELVIEEIYKKVTRDLNQEIRKLLNFKERDAKKLITYFVFFVLDAIEIGKDPLQELEKLDKEKLNRYLGFQHLDKYTNQLFDLFTHSIKKGIVLYYQNESNEKVNVTRKDFTTDNKGSLFFNRLKERYLIRNGDQYPMLVNEYIIASCIRYHYMDLGSIGLATMYKSMGYMPEDDVLEAFSSVLNRYFINYCSAFTDVDVNSRGNFFKLGKVSQSVMVVNPPFEISIMSDAFKKCRELYKNNPNLTCHFIIPDWKDWPELDQLEKDSFKVMRFGKEDKTFIDYEARKEIHPCPVVYCYFGKEREIDKNGKIIIEKIEEEKKIEEVDVFEMLRFEKLLYKF